MEVAEGCKLGVRYYLPQTVEVVTVPVEVLPSEEPSEDFAQNEAEDADALRTILSERDRQIESLQKQLQVTSQQKAESEK